MQLIPLCTIRVKRDTKSVTPEIGKPFDFTADEKDDLDNLAKQTGNDYYRLPVNETAPVAAIAVAEPEVEAEQSEDVKPAAKSGKAAKKADESL